MKPGRNYEEGGVLEGRPIPIAASTTDPPAGVLVGCCRRALVPQP